MLDYEWAILLFFNFGASRFFEILMPHPIKAHYISFFYNPWGWIGRKVIQISESQVTVSLRGRVDLQNSIILPWEHSICQFLAILVEARLRIQWIL